MGHEPEGDGGEGLAFGGGGAGGTAIGLKKKNPDSRGGNVMHAA
jgi:hypothetical protein